jgi:uncharacterized OB-fold protein
MKGGDNMRLHFKAGEIISLTKFPLGNAPLVRLEDGKEMLFSATICPQVARIGDKVRLKYHNKTVRGISITSITKNEEAQRFTDIMTPNQE